MAAIEIANDASSGGSIGVVTACNKDRQNCYSSPICENIAIIVATENCDKIVKY